MILTTIQQRMLQHIHQAGGEVRGLWGITDQLAIDYAGTYRRLQEMHAMGVVTVRRSGRCLVISAPQKMPVFESSGRVGVSYRQNGDSRPATRLRGSR